MLLRIFLKPKSWNCAINVFVTSLSMGILTSNLQNVTPAEVKIVVRDNVMLVPGHDVYILVNTSVTYSVIRLNRGKASGLFGFDMLHVRSLWLSCQS